MELFALIDIFPHKTQGGQGCDEDGRFHRELGLSELDIDEDNADDERDQCYDEAGKLLIIICREIIVRSFHKMLTVLYRIVEPEFQIGNTRNAHESDGDEADHGSCHEAGSQVGRRYRVVDLNCAGGDHTKGRDAEEERTGKGTSGKIRFTPDFQSDRENAECADVGGDAAVGKDGAGDRDRDEGPVFTDTLDDRLGYTPRRVGDIHEFRQYRTCQEQQEIILEEPHETCHIGFLECFIRRKPVEDNNDCHTNENGQVQIEVLHDEKHQ